MPDLSGIYTPDPRITKGFGALGDLLTGDIGTPGVYEKTLKESSGAEKALQDARRARSLALIDAGRVDARNRLTPKLLQAALAGDVTAQAELGANVLGGNSTMNLGQLGKFQQPHFGEASNIQFDALGLGESPEVDAQLANRANAFLSGDSFQPVRALGGNLIEDGVTLGDADLVPLPQTLAEIERKQAATEKLRREPAPKPARPPTAAAEEAQVLAQARERIAGGADPAQVADFLRSKGYPGVADRIHKIKK